MNGAAAGLEDREHHAIEGAVAGVRGVFDSSGVLWLPDDGVLVVSDLHLEKGAAFARRGRLIPPYDSAATLARLAAVITRYEPRAVISLGDSFHDGVGAAMMPPVYRDALVNSHFAIPGVHMLRLKGEYAHFIDPTQRIVVMPGVPVNLSHFKPAAHADYLWYIGENPLGKLPPGARVIYRASGSALAQLAKPVAPR